MYNFFKDLNNQFSTFCICVDIFLKNFLSFFGENKRSSFGLRLWKHLLIVKIFLGTLFQLFVAAYRKLHQAACDSENCSGLLFTKGCHQRKIYRLKEDQAFSLLLELGQREKVARHPSADFLLHSIGGGGDFVDTVIVVKVV
jgi:hypothetical protein